ncbi:SEC-C metal-binding domain-containing protein [Roseivirga sp. BDSF3-8]|uniref:SEC-C metal-binding domain-containing protein n=1 Tax=Roseivirga sp. BDSF3-8 TaxID=3241598 RepID=UPI003531E2AE
MNRNEILSKIDELSKCKNFLEILGLLVAKNINGKVKDIGYEDYKRLLSYKEISHLSGFYLKNRNNKSNTELDTESTADQIHKLMDSLHFTFFSNDEKSFDPSKIEREMLLHETIFYSGGDAHDFQFVELARYKYQNDRGWIKKHKGFDIYNAYDNYMVIRSLMDFIMNIRHQHANPSNVLTLNKDNPIFKRNPDIKQLIEAFAIQENEVVNEFFFNIGDYNEFLVRPIFIIDNYYVILMPYQLAEAVFNNPFYWMNKDKIYSSKALKNRGGMAENMVFQMLTEKYGDRYIFKNVLLKKNSTTTISDIDILMLFEEIAVIFQVKSKRLTENSKKGDLKSIKIDFEKAIKAAHKQALTCKEAIRKKEYNSNSSKNLPDLKNVKEVYSICLLLDEYPGKTSHVRIIMEGEPDKPIVISAFDLDIILRHLPTKVDFTKYLIFRYKNRDRLVAASERAFLGGYLFNGDEINNNINDRPIILDEDHSQYFDRLMFGKHLAENRSKFLEALKDIERNDRCFCESGLKYKKCCMQNFDGRLSP